MQILVPAEMAKYMLFQARVPPHSFPQFVASFTMKHPHCKLEGASRGTQKKSSREGHL